MTTCEMCGETLVEHCATITRKAVLRTIKYGVEVQVVDKVCSKCGELNFYDGLYDHVFNFNNEELYTHDLLNGFSSSCKHQKRPTISSYCKQIRDWYVANNGSINFVSDPHFVTVMMSFLYKQEWKCYLLCPGCDRGLKDSANGEFTGTVDEIVADGVQTGFSRKYASLVINPKTIYDETYIVDCIVRKSDRFIPNAKMRKILDRFLYRHLPALAQDRVCFYFRARIMSKIPLSNKTTTLIII